MHFKWRWSIFDVIYLFSIGIWKSFAHSSVSFFSNTNVNNTDHTPAFIGIFLIREDEDLLKNEMEHFLTVLIFTAPNMMRQMAYVLMVTSEYFWCRLACNATWSGHCSKFGGKTDMSFSVLKHPFGLDLPFIVMVKLILFHFTKTFVFSFWKAFTYFCLIKRSDHFTSSR